MPMLLHSRCPKPVHISSLGTNLAVVCTDIADCWLRKEYSVQLIIRKLEQVVTHWNAIFQLAYGLTTDQSVYFHMWNCSWNYKPIGVCEWGFSLTVKLWENHDLTELSVITYIYLCGWIYASCLSYFSNRPSGIEQKLNWNVTGIKANIPISFYHIQTGGA
jgi:hypothetical protein